MEPMEHILSVTDRLRRRFARIRRTDAEVDDDSCGAPRTGSDDGGAGGGGAGGIHFKIAIGCGLDHAANGDTVQGVRVNWAWRNTCRFVQAILLQWLPGAVFPEHQAKGGSVFMVTRTDMEEIHLDPTWRRSAVWRSAVRRQANVRVAVGLWIFNTALLLIDEITHLGGTTFRL